MIKWRLYLVIYIVLVFDRLKSPLLKSYIAIGPLKLTGSKGRKPTAKCHTCYRGGPGSGILSLNFELNFTTIGP